MHWDSSPHAGFTTGDPWIGVNPNYQDINAEAELADPDSVFHHYRRLIELRRTRPVVALGDYRPLLVDDPVVFAFTRRLDREELLVIANVSGDSTIAAVDADGWRDAEVVITNDDGVRPVDGRFELRPWEAFVLRR